MSAQQTAPLKTYVLEYFYANVKATEGPGPWGKKKVYTKQTHGLP